MQKKSTPDSSVSRSQKLFADQVDKQFQHTLFGTAATIINGIILVFILRKQIPPLNLYVWLICAFIVSLFRLLVQYLYHKSPKLPKHYKQWNNWFRATLLLSGTLWGATAIFLFPPQSIGHQAFIAFVIGGMVAGAAASFTSVVSAFFLFSTPALVPICIRFFTSGTEIHAAMGVMILIYYTIISLTAIRMHRDIVDLFATQYEKIELIDHLEQEVDMRKEAQEDLRQQNVHIEDIVAERTSQLQNANQRLNAILNSAPLAIWAIDKTGKVVFAEGRGLERIGFTSNYVMNKNLFTLFSDNKQVVEITERVLQGEIVAETVNYAGIHFEVRYQPILRAHAEVNGAIGVGIDITDQVNAKRELRDEKDKHQEIIESINDVVYSMDSSGKLIFISPSINTVLGYQDFELIGTSLFDVVHHEDIQQLKYDIKNSPQEKIGYGEYRFFHKNDEIRWCRVSSNLANDVDLHSEVRGVLVDITDFKRLEEQLHRAQKMEAIGTLAGGVAHDLNNILSGIVSYPELLLMDISTDNPLYSPLTTIKKSGENAAAIVQDLLTLARRGVSTHDLININSIVEEYIQSPEFQTMLNYQSNISLTTELREDLMNIFGSSIHLFKSLSNLLSNAFEALPEGGEVKIATDHRYIDREISGFDTVNEGEYVILSVEDNGIGISSEDRVHIFEPFYTKKVMGKSGSGLGMAVVWGTVKDHNGYIDLQSEEGKGAKFDLYFPATREGIVNVSGKTQLQDIFGNGELILVVDDIQVQLDIAEGILKRLGYQVKTAVSGEAAISHLKSNPVDLVILDMIMEPGIDGYETFRLIKEFKPEQKAIIASGYSETSKVRMAQELGAGPYVKKPYSLETIGSIVKKELSR